MKGGSFMAGLETNFNFKILKTENAIRQLAAMIGPEFEKKIEFQQERHRKFKSLRSFTATLRETAEAIDDLTTELLEDFDKELELAVLGYRGGES